MAKGHFEVGTKFGDWTVIAQVEKALDPPVRGASRAYFSRVRCVCGTEKDLANGYLRSGQSNGCGCKRGLKFAQSRITHGKSYTPIYGLWQSIKHRLKYDLNYVNAGTKMHEPWVDDFEAFETFILSLGPKPTPEHTLDRIEPSGDYEPKNLRWADKTVQSTNRRNSMLRNVEQNSKLHVGQRHDRLVITELMVVRRNNRNFYGARVKCDCGTEKTIMQQQILNGRTKSCGCLKNENLSLGAAGNSKPVTVDGVTRTLSEWARRLGTSIQTIRARIDAGWTHERAATEPLADAQTLTIDGVTKSVRQWAITNGIPYNVAYRRIQNGWDATRAVSEPTRAWQRKNAQDLN